MYTHIRQQSTEQATTLHASASSTNDKYIMARLTRFLLLLRNCRTKDCYVDVPFLLPRAVFRDGDDFYEQH